MLTGVTTREGAERFPYRPTHILDSVADIEPAQAAVGGDGEHRSEPAGGMFTSNKPSRYP